MDVSTRRLRYFVAVAEELHFTRAAAKVFVSQQSLSKQIRELESELGTPLFERNTRRVELTPAGTQFLVACRDVLARLDAAVRNARGEAGSLNLGFFVFAAVELTTPILTEFDRRHPEVTVALQEFAYQDPSAGLAGGTTDLAFVRLPLAVPDLRYVPLYTEPRVVAVPAGHRLAGRDGISVRELEGERLTRSVNTDPVFHRFWSLTDHLRQAAEPIPTASHSEELQVVGTGRALSITAASAARFAPHADVSYVPITDVAGVTTALAWTDGRGSALVEQFVAVAALVCERETEIRRAIENP